MISLAVYVLFYVSLSYNKGGKKTPAAGTGKCKQSTTTLACAGHAV